MRCADAPLFRTISSALLLLVVDPHQHADKFTRDLAVMLIQPLQISDQLDVGRFEARQTIAALAGGRTRLRSAKTQPFRRYPQPLRDHAQLFMGRNRLAYQPLARRVDRNRAPIEANVKFPCQTGGTVGRVVSILESLLQALAKAFAFIGRFDYCTFSRCRMYVSRLDAYTYCDINGLIV